MKVTIHAEGSAKEIASQLTEAAAVYAGKAGATAAPAASATAAPKAGKKAKAAPVDEEEFSEEESEETEETEEESEAGEAGDDFGEESEEAEEEEESEGPTQEDLIKAFQKYAKKHSREKAAEVLKKFGAKNVKAIKEAQYAKVLSVLKK